MSWTEFLADKSQLKAVFGDDMPSLEGITLHEVNIQRDGPKVVLIFDVNQFPGSPPKKWKLAGFNTVQMSLIAFEVTELTIGGIETELRGNINISNCDKGFLLSIENSKLSLRLIASHLMIGKLSAYVDNKE